MFESCECKKRVKTGLPTPSEKRKGVGKTPDIGGNTTLQDSILTAGLKR